MFVFKSIKLLQDHLSENRPKFGKVGFVPTMGALHQGHLDLISASKTKGCYTVCTIYVNPTQFNNTEDFEKYPSTIELDIVKLTQNKCDLLFLPSSTEMYGNHVVADKYNFGTITNSFEGALRPGHFDGVITIVSKLFDAVKPDEVFFGQKDLQQCMVVKHLINKRFSNIQMNIVPTKRESSGLAMSSRNVRLNDDERALAIRLYEALVFVKHQVLMGVVASEAISIAKAQWLNHPKLTLEYLALVDTNTMEQQEIAGPELHYAVIIACWCSNVRLIDNMLLTD